MRRSISVVKQPPRPGPHVRPLGIGRHFEGWQLGALTVCIASLAALLSVPRSVEPETVPLPRVNVRAQEQSAEAERRSAALAAARPLPFEVRSVGECVRRLGRAEASGDTEASGAIHAQLSQSVLRARNAYGDEPLLELRAVQTQLLLRALATWEADGRITPDLRELGGALIQDACQAGWLTADRRFKASSHVRRVLFRLRWGKMTGLGSEPPFAIGLNDWRTYYRFLLRHPIGQPGGLDERTQALRQLRIVGALEKHDPSYPAALARGVCHYRAGAYLAAAEAFRLHLDEHPEGPWALRARNHLAAALERLGTPESP